MWPVCFVWATPRKNFTPLTLQPGPGGQLGLGSRLESFEREKYYVALVTSRSVALGTSRSVALGTGVPHFQNSSDIRCWCCRQCRQCSPEVKCRWFLGLASTSVVEDARRRLGTGGLEPCGAGKGWLTLRIVNGSRARVLEALPGPSPLEAGMLRIRRV